MKSPQELWPWIRWGRRPPRPPIGSPLLQLPHLAAIGNLPFSDRLAFYRRHRKAIRKELEQIREGPTFRKFVFGVVEHRMQ